MNDERRYRCGCDPGTHPDPTRFSPCQRDLVHVYGNDNPMVKWLREKHPGSLDEPAYTIGGTGDDVIDLDDLADDEEYTWGA